MATLLQINVTANSGSTGKIAEQINLVAQQQGWKTYIAYGRNVMPSNSELIKVGNKIQVYEHYMEHRLFDNEGHASRFATMSLVREVEKIKPDVIHLHNIHDHWLNYRILFEYLNTLNVPIVWTQHDCWAFTGGCGHFSYLGCYRWRDGGCTQKCPWRKNHTMRRLFEKTQKNYSLKKKLFTANKNLTIVPVSYWLERLIKDSYLKTCPIQTIHNGIDINTFYPCDSSCVRIKYNIGNCNYVIGVASAWVARKGFADFLKLSELIPEGMKVVLVGLNGKLLEEAKKYPNVVVVPRTENVQELAALYSGAELFLNLTYQDNYPTTNLEAMACGTPVVTYKTGGSVEAITDETGWIVEQGDLATVITIIEDCFKRISVKDDSTKIMRRKCRERAEKEFNKEDRYKEYMDLYNKLLKIE